MPKIKHVLILSIVIVILALATYGISLVKQSMKVADDITLDEIKDCETIYWDEPENIYGTCTSSYELNQCDDEPINQSCHMERIINAYSCITGQNISVKSKEICKDKEFALNVKKLIGEKKYKLNYADWGKCSYTPGNDSVIIICDSKLDGNSDGICQPGESCIAFIVSKDSTQRLFRNSRNDFVIDDPTFYQQKIDTEVEE